MIKKIAFIVFASVILQGCQSTVVVKEENPRKVIDNIIYDEFNKEPLKDIIASLNKKYGLNIVMSYDVERMQKSKVSVNSEKNLPLNKFLDSLTDAVGKVKNKKINWQINGNRIILYWERE